eukprot:1597324-Rhodomonas_salina.1
MQAQGWTASKGTAVTVKSLFVREHPSSFPFSQRSKSPHSQSAASNVSMHAMLARKGTAALSEG